jgi:CheY-like chemotaxis protein
MPLTVLAVLVANSAHEGLEELDKDKQNLVVADIAMPLMN